MGSRDPDTAGETTKYNVSIMLHYILVTMALMLATLAGVFTGATPAAVRSPSAIFNDIFIVFVGLGTLVGVVVMGYMLWKAWQYRAGDGKGEGMDVDRPSLGELPTGGDGGRKLFLSFAISTIIVVSLIIWTYGALLAVESGPAVADTGQEPLEVEVTGFQFAWQFEYPNGHTTTNTLRVPEDRPVVLTVTSDDVFHNFGIPALSLKADAIPGQTTETWFVAEETGTHQAQCYELCGSGHSYMTAQVIVMEPDAYQDWYESTGNETAS
jgi:cytochrome c oxidase subunit 2